MKRSDVVTLMSLLGSKVGSGDEWIQCSCPYAPWNHTNGTDNHPSFSVKVSDKGESSAQCFTCGSHTNLYGLVLELKRLSKQEELVDIDFKAAMEIALRENEDSVESMDDLPDYDESVNKKKTTLQPFNTKWLNSFMQGYHHPYLASRGVTPEIAQELDVRYDSQADRVCFPVRDKNGILMGLHGRYVNPPSEGLRYHSYAYQGQRNMSVWMNENNMDLDAPLVLTEGPFDVASIMRVYRNVVASLTSALSTKKLNRIADAISIVTLYDYGTGGDHARNRLTTFCNNRGIPVYHLMLSEEVGDAGNMTEDHLKEVLKSLTNDCY